MMFTNDEQVKEYYAQAKKRNPWDNIRKKQKEGKLHYTPVRTDQPIPEPEYIPYYL